MTHDYWNHTDENYINSQKYMECQLVTAINAAICLNELPVRPNSPEYERLVDLVCGRNGSAISIELAWRYLRLKTFEVDFSWENIKKYLKGEVINQRNPIEFGVYHKCRHSVLVVDCEEKGGKRLRVANFPSATNKEGWIAWKKFLVYVRKYKGGKKQETMRVFMLDPWYIRQLQIESNERTERYETKNVWPSMIRGSYEIPFRNRSSRRRGKIPKRTRLR